ncbi:hypothetical protein [Nonomuraea sp. SYSU D8015]|uniref:hypothetical protein n=1 Tax=Nonomuraea sp. SYSU D8015 TaxID=2593644 RepID=UPI0016603B9B|nr:hypothetical protein [Nonomuraea sp. SYSU D8015]
MNASVPASAAPADLVIDYDCLPAGPSSIVRHGPVRLTTNLTFATDLTVGDPLNFAWKLNYTGDGSRLQSPGYFGEGAQVHATGNVELKSNWVGILQPRGSADPEGPLRPDLPLGLPPMLNDPGLTNRPGTIRITPKDIELDFTPPDNSVVINDGDDTDNPSDMQIVYSGGWTSVDDRPGSEHHVHNDLHETTQMGASAELKFVGTSVEYIGPHDKDAGKVDIYIDGIKRATVDPSRDGNDDPVNDDLDGGHTLWESPQLKYGEHTIKIQSASTKPVWLDAFEVSTATSQIPTGYHSAICKPVANPVSIEVTVRDRTSPTNTSTSTNTPTDGPTNTSSGSPTSSSSGSPSGSPTTSATQPNYSYPTVIGSHTVVIPRATGTTSTATPKTTGPTATKYVRPQVAKTPRGGVDSGEAPDGPQEAPYALMASGAMLIAGSAGGGLLLRRRRAAHAGGVK